MNRVKLFCVEPRLSDATPAPAGGMRGWSRRRIAIGCLSALGGLGELEDLAGREGRVDRKGLALRLLHGGMFSPEGESHLNLR
jgi:hypothetical protein